MVSLSSSSKEELCYIIDRMADNDIQLLLVKVREFKRIGQFCLSSTDFAASSTILASSSEISFKMP